MRPRLGTRADEKRLVASAVLEAMKDPAQVAQVPVTWSLEVANVIARAEARGIVHEAQSEAFLAMLAALPVRPDAATFPRALADDLLRATRKAGRRRFDP